MESVGEVGILMSMGGANSGGEILKTLLSVSKAQKPEQIELNVLEDLQGRGQAEDQLVLQIEVAEPIKSQFLPNNDNIIQHIPITYLTTDNPNLAPVSNGAFVEPVTYVLSRDVLPENRYCEIGRNEPQKIILVQEMDPNALPQYENPEAKLFAVKDRQPNQCEYSELWDVDRGVSASAGESGLNCEVGRKSEEKSKECKKQKKSEDSGGTVRGRRGKAESREKLPGTNTKVQKKISSSKKPLNKRKSSKLKNKLKTCGKAMVKKPDKPPEDKKPPGEEKDRHHLFELTKLEDNVDQVADRLKIGCECSDSNCFDGLNPDDVFKHRLNIADLTKSEHDMYLMGVIMASIHNLEETCRHKERIRIRSCYAYQGKKVCLTAFLYLQHVTLYQMKRLRSHLKNHGVSPRIHGNRGRKPANTLSLDIYRRATNFVQSYIEKHCVKTVPNFTTFSSNKIGSNSIAGGKNAKVVAKKENSIKIANKMTSYHLPPECTKRRVHRDYKSFCENLKLSQKVMKYSTFTNFLKKQFPNVKFHKREEKKQERSTGKLEESEKWKLKETKGQESERKSKEDQGVDKSIQVDKCIQVDKSLTYIPVKTQIVVDQQQVEPYEEGNTGREYEEGNTGKEYEEGNTGREYEEGNTGKEYEEGNTGKEYEEGNTGKEYEEGSTGKEYGVTNHGLVGSQSYGISQTQSTEQYYAIDNAV